MTRLPVQGAGNPNRSGGGCQSELSGDPQRGCSRTSHRSAALLAVPLGGVAPRPQNPIDLAARYRRQPSFHLRRVIVNRGEERVIDAVHVPAVGERLAELSLRDTPRAPIARLTLAEAQQEEMSPGRSTPRTLRS